MGDCEKLKKNHQQKIGQLEKARSNKSMRFGRSVPALLAEIEKLYRAGKFTKKPIGPIGAHITIKDMKYALGAERAMGEYYISVYFYQSTYIRHLLIALRNLVRDLVAYQ